VELYALDIDDSFPEFQETLSKMVDKSLPDMIAGGAAHFRSGLTADFFRRLGLSWFGPWSNSPDLYRGHDDDPVGILPPADMELEALFAYASKNLGQEAKAYFVLSRASDSESLLKLARSKAEKYALNLSPITLPQNFRDWSSLKGSFPEAGAIILWVAPGPAAAIRRTMLRQVPSGVLWMTNSLNSPGREVSEMTAGAWDGMIFPAVLNPREEISESYDLVLRKHGLPGLNLDYQTYLGFAQGQIIARALMDSSENRLGIASALGQVSAQGTILYRSRFVRAKPGPEDFYLARATRQAGWQALP
jgi:ABC-type branched-subunit amino acid transport system substrate-binding protein